MENISIGTAQNVEIGYELASAGDRMTAQLIDLFILYGYVFLYFLIANADDTLRDFMEKPYPIFILVVFPFIFYHLLFEVFNNGQSPGKMLRKTKVVQLDGSQPSIASYLLRWLFSMLEITFNMGSIALVTMLLNQKGQRLGDIAAGTTVVKLRDDVSLDHTIFENLHDKYHVVFRESEHLTDEDARLSRDVINAFMERDIDKNKADTIALTMSDYLKRKLAINSDMPPISFLDTLLKDYNKIHGHVTS